MMKAVWTRREIILLPAIMVGLVVIAQLNQMWRRIEMVLRGSIHVPPEVRSRPQLDPKWIEVLKLKHEEGLTDVAIAKRMDVSDRTLRNYWLRISDALAINSDVDKDTRSQIALKARKLGLID